MKIDQETGSIEGRKGVKIRILWNSLCLALALLLGATSAAWADLTVCSVGCEVSNLIDSDRTWTAATYQVQEHVLVRQGVTLTLEPGVTIKFTTQMGLQVAGTLIARGTEERPITFSSNQASPARGDWGTILFTETAIGASFDGVGDYTGGSIFDHCVVEYGGGGIAQGAIWAKSPRSPFVYRSTIRSNAASGIWLEGTQEARVQESTISGNSTSHGGGGIYVSASGMAVLSGNTLSENTARRGGGIMVYVSSSGTATLSANTLLRNSASDYGGGISISSSGTATLSANTISENNAEGSGGGIYVSSSGTAILSANTVSENSAGWGGGIYVSVSIDKARATLSANTVSENGAEGDGGGIYVSIDKGTATLFANTILENSAKGSGGGINLSSSSGTATLSANTISENSAGWEKSAGWGGGICIESQGTVAIRENLVLDNAALPLLDEKGNIKEEGKGGGLHIYRGHPTLSRNDFLGNTPTQLWNGNAAASSNLDARDNWWGAPEEVEIQQGIWDGNDDPSLGEVDWQPYLTAPTSANHPPFPPGTPFPDDGAREVARNPTLRWSAGTDPDLWDIVSYDIYFGTEADPPLVSSGQRSTSYSPVLLERNTTYYWRVMARDSQRAKIYGARWSFNTGDRPGPTLDPIGDQTISEGQVLSFALSGSDPDGNQGLVFSASNLPPGASFDPTTRRFSWTLTYRQAGTYRRVRFSVSDGTYTDSEEIAVTVANVNGPPLLDPFGNQTVSEGQVLSFVLSGSDPDGNRDLVFSASNLPPGASFDPATSRFSWTPLTTRRALTAGCASRSAMGPIPTPKRSTSRSWTSTAFPS